MKRSKAKLYLIPALLCLAGVAAIGYFHFFTAFSSHADKQYVYIDNDDTADSVYIKLKSVATSHALTGFRTLARHFDYNENIRPGRYAIEPSISTIDVFRMIRNGQKLGYDTATIASLFVPNTYEVYWNTDIDKFMQRMVKEHDAFWTTERRQKASRLGLSPEQVCTLASIIDEETANNGEKPMIAGMYLNRLKVGMPLQADPTVKFALQDFSLKRIYHNHLTVNSPYNTYKNIGLPPGPIKVASIQGIDAVLNRVQHNYLYMCAKEDFSGTHNFAMSYQEHLKNAARYSEALNQRGIK